MQGICEFTLFASFMLMFLAIFAVVSFQKQTTLKYNNFTPTDAYINRVWEDRYNEQSTMNKIRLKKYEEKKNAIH